MDEKNLDLLLTSLKNLGVSLTDKQLCSLVKFYELTMEANERFNLTAITDERDFIIKHIADSLAAAPLIPVGARLIDIGAGAGFPSVPLAIARADIRVTALDSTLKKTTFIADSAMKLGLENISAVAGRAEEQTSLFNSFDVATARAVAKLNVLLELAAPLIKVGGLFIAYKADDSELSISQNAQKALNMALREVKEFVLPNGDPRALLVFEKTAETQKKYPRRYSLIKKSPL